MAKGSFRARYFLKTNGTAEVILPSERSDGWSTAMNANWVELKTRIDQNLITSAQNKASADQLGGGSVPHVSQLTNPNFAIWQRATSLSVSATAAYGPDAWKVQASAGRTGTAQRYQASSGEDIHIQLFATNGGGAADRLQLLHRTERFKALRGKTVTLSVDLRCQNVFGDSNTTAELRLDDGITSKETAFTVAAKQVLDDSHWTRFTITHPISATASQLETVLKMQAGVLASGLKWETRRATLVVGNYPSGVIYQPAGPGTDALRAFRYYEKFVPQKAGHDDEREIRIPVSDGGDDNLLLPMRMAPKYGGGSVTITPDFTFDGSGLITVTGDVQDTALTLDLDIDGDTFARMNSIEIKAELF